MSGKFSFLDLDEDYLKSLKDRIMNDRGNSNRVLISNEVGIAMAEYSKMRRLVESLGFKAINFDGKPVPYIPLEDCKVGYMYILTGRIHSPYKINYGVYLGKGCFAYLRTKFDTEYVDIQYHWDRNRDGEPIPGAVLKPIHEAGFTKIPAKRLELYRSHPIVQGNAHIKANTSTAEVIANKLRQLNIN